MGFFESINDTFESAVNAVADLYDETKDAISRSIKAKRQHIPNLEDFRRKKAIIDKIKEKYGLIGAGDEDCWCNIQYTFKNESVVLAWVENREYSWHADSAANWGCASNFTLKYPEPDDNYLNNFAVIAPQAPLDYYLDRGGQKYFNDDATFEEVEKEVVFLIERLKALQIEYKEKKAEDDFDEKAIIFEELKSHYHLIELDYPINSIRYAYSPDIKYFVIGYCKARNQIYIPRGVVTQSITIAGTTRVNLPNVWELECQEDKLSYTKYDEYKNHIDDIIKQYKELELKKWEKYNI